MFAPLAVISEWSTGVSLFVSLLIGIGFGFALERAGFGNSRKLAMQFYFKDMTVFKVMFTAMIVAMAGVIFLGGIGWLDVTSMYINPTYLWSGIVGCVIMGMGFAIGGYCPGTSVVGLSTFKIDAMYYIFGAFIGVFIFAEIETIIAPLFRGEYSGYMGRITIYDALGVPAGVVGFAVILMALGGFWGAEWIEKKFGDKVEPS